MYKPLIYYLYWQQFISIDMFNFSIHVLIFVENLTCFWSSQLEVLNILQFKTFYESIKILRRIIFKSNNSFTTVVALCPHGMRWIKSSKSVSKSTVIFSNLTWKLPILEYLSSKTKFYSIQYHYAHIYVLAMQTYLYNGTPNYNSTVFGRYHIDENDNLNGSGILNTLKRSW